jgi:hypothetical protein
LNEGGNRLGRRRRHPALDLRRTFDRRALDNRGGLLSVGGIDGQRPLRAGPDASQAGIGVPRDQDATCIARLQRHLDKESRDAGGCWLGLGDIMQRLA